MDLTRFAAAALTTALGASSAVAQEPPPTPKTLLKDELRMPWKRSDEAFLRQWLVAGPFPCKLAADCLSGQAGEAAARPADGQELKRADGTSVRWHTQKAWSDDATFGDLPGAGEGAVAYAFTRLTRQKAGPALLSIGSRDGVRVWLNGRLVLSRDASRSATPDEDRVPVELNAGENALLVKALAESTFYARVLEPGSVLVRKAELGPSIVELSPEGFSLVTDVGPERRGRRTRRGWRSSGAGGQAVFTATASRGAKLKIDARSWPDGPYELRCSTHAFTGLLYATHLPWYKGDSLAKARELASTAAAADAQKPEGFTLRMLADMVEDRLGVKLSEARGNPWQKIHAPLMEYEELMLERQGQTGRIRPYGFVRLAWRDDVDGSPQFCRAYLPPGYQRRHEVATRRPDPRLQPRQPGLRALVGRGRAPPRHRHRVLEPPGRHLHRAPRPRQHAVRGHGRQRRRARDRRGEAALRRRRGPRLPHRRLDGRLGHLERREPAPGPVRRDRARLRRRRLPLRDLGGGPREGCCRSSGSSTRSRAPGPWPTAC